jgi:hypothetical protein
MDEGYRFEMLDPVSPGELASVSALLRRVFPKARHLTERYLAWQYAANPAGTAVGYNAWAGDALVGHMAALPMAARIEGEQRLGMFIVNGAVDAAHRRRRLQSRISDAMFEEGVRRGYAFCLSTGNRQSTVPLLTRFRMLRPLEARLGFGTPARAARAFEPSFERIWTEESLRWRVANPERRYAAQVLDGRLTLFADTGLPGIDALLYDGPGRCAEEGGAGVRKGLRVWIGLDPALSWPASLPIPKRLRPSPLNLVYRHLSGGGFLPDPERIVLSGLDLDAY